MTLHETITCYQCSRAAEPGADVCGHCGTRLLAEAISLPPSRALQRFVAAASDLDLELAQQLDTDEARLRDLTQRTRQRKRLRGVLGQLTGLIHVELTPVASAPPDTTTSDRWSRKYAACRMCGRTDRFHKARGYCAACYFKAPVDE